LAAAQVAHLGIPAYEAVPVVAAARVMEEPVWPVALAYPVKGSQAAQVRHPQPYLQIFAVQVVVVRLPLA
jgi:hypothetical protein